MTVKNITTANLIANKILESNYFIQACGIRDLDNNELIEFIKIIRSNSIGKISYKLDELYKNSKLTISMDKALMKKDCCLYSEDDCDCFLPNVKHEDCFCKRQRKKYLEKTDYRNTKEYKEWRTSVFERDNYICQDCKQQEGELNAHHIKKYKDFPKDRYDIKNGITLCVECHKLRHKKEI